MWQGRDTVTAETLAREHSDFDLSLIQPGPVSGGVMDCEAIPYLRADVIAEQIGEGFPPVNVEVVHNQMKSADGGILERKLDSNLANSVVAERQNAGGFPAHARH